MWTSAVPRAASTRPISRWRWQPAGSSRCTGRRRGIVAVPAPDRSMPAKNSGALGAPPVEHVALSVVVFRAVPAARQFTAQEHVLQAASRVAASSACCRTAGKISSRAPSARRRPRRSDVAEAGRVTRQTADWNGRSSRSSEARPTEMTRSRGSPGARPIHQSARSTRCYVATRQAARSADDRR